MQKTSMHEFVGYEYKEIIGNSEEISMYLDCYENFGWEVDHHSTVTQELHKVRVVMKRDRRIINKMELTRLQRHFESCINEIQTLKRSEYSAATAKSLATGMGGTAFMAGATFAAVHIPPIIWLCILLAIPGFIGWGAAYFVYKKQVEKRRREIGPLLEDKYDEIYEICKKGHDLL